MPKPKAQESHDDFIARCMGSAEANRDFPDQDQRFAFCSNQWEAKNKAKKKKRKKGYGMNTNLVLQLSATNGAALRTEQYMGRDFLVVPAVLVRSQILHNNLGTPLI